MAELGIQDKIALRVVDSIGRNIAYNFDLIRHLITISMDSAQASDIMLNHEVVHALREIGLFRDAEWQTLSKRALFDLQLMRSIKRRYVAVGLRCLDC